MSAGPGSVRVRSRVFHTPKAGHREDEYEDAWAYSEGGVLPYRAAVADGATESAFARPWAEHLVAEWVREPALSETDFKGHLTAWQAEWSEAVAGRARDLPWYAQAKLEQGAFAAFLGLSLEPDGAWRAVAVGDCCLFVLSKGIDPTSWPLDSPEQFHSSPLLVPSVPGVPTGPVQTLSGTWKPSDTFVLATDAVAAWLLRIDPAHALDPTEERFPAHIQKARSEGVLRNDDATLVVLELAAAS